MKSVLSPSRFWVVSLLCLLSVFRIPPPVAGAEQEADDQRVLRALIAVEKYSLDHVGNARQQYIKAKEKLLESCPTLELLDVWNSELDAFEADRSFPLIPEFADDAARFDRARGFHAIAMTDLVYKVRGLASRRKWSATYKYCNTKLFREKDALGKPRMAVLPGGHASAYSLLDRSMKCAFYKAEEDGAGSLHQATEPLHVSKHADGSIGFEWNNDEFKPLFPANKGRKRFNDIFGRTEDQTFILGNRGDNTRWKQFYDIDDGGRNDLYLSYYSPFGDDLDRVREFGKVSVMALVWSNPEFERVFNDLLTVLKDKSGVAAIGAEVKMTKSFGE